MAKNRIELSVERLPDKEGQAVGTVEVRAMTVCGKTRRTVLNQRTVFPNTPGTLHIWLELGTEVSQPGDAQAVSVS